MQLRVLTWRTIIYSIISSSCQYTIDMRRIDRIFTTGCGVVVVKTTDENSKLPFTVQIMRINWTITKSSSKRFKREIAMGVPLTHTRAQTHAHTYSEEADALFRTSAFELVESQNMLLPLKTKTNVPVIELPLWENKCLHKENIYFFSS